VVLQAHFFIDNGRSGQLLGISTCNKGGCSMRKTKKATRKPAKKAAARKAPRMRCTAKTKAGKACKRFTNGKKKFCSVHS
jgi:hypothetical protein